MPQDIDSHTNHRKDPQASFIDDEHLADDSHKEGQQESSSNDNVDDDANDNTNETKVTEDLKDNDLPEEISDEDKETIKKVANDDNLSHAKSYASILVEQVMDAKETFERSLGSLFTSAFTAGLEIGISFFMILSAFALLNEVIPSHYAMVLSSLLYPIGFIIVVIGQSLLFTEQTSLLSFRS